MTYQNFRSIQENIMLIEGALHGDFVIPEFGQFTKHLEEIYHHCKENAEGKVGMNDQVKVKMYISHYHTSNRQTYICTLCNKRYGKPHSQRETTTGQSFNFIIDNNKKVRMTEESKTSTLACFSTYEQDMCCLATVQDGIWLDLNMKKTDLIMIENLHKIFVGLYYGQETFNAFLPPCWTLQWH